MSNLITPEEWRDIALLTAVQPDTSHTRFIADLVTTWYQGVFALGHDDDNTVAMVAILRTHLAQSPVLRARRQVVAAAP